jgi:hypothetical protein
MSNPVISRCFIIGSPLCLVRWATCFSLMWWFFFLLIVCYINLVLVEPLKFFGSMEQYYAFNFVHA